MKKRDKLPDLVLGPCSVAPPRTTSLFPKNRMPPLQAQPSPVNAKPSGWDPFPPNPPSTTGHPKLRCEDVFHPRPAPTNDPKPSAESVFGPCRPKSVMDMIYPKEPVVTLFTTPEER
jgi:hypothetical protein